MEKRDGTDEPISDETMAGIEPVEEEALLAQATDEDETRTITEGMDSDGQEADGKKGPLTRIPQEIIIKPAFVEHYKRLLGDRYDEFMRYSLSYITKSIRVNTLKIGVDELRRRMEKDWILTPVPWCREGFFIEYRHGKRFDIGNLPEHQFGHFYIQDAASMIPPVVLDPKPGMLVLDLCAAPGSKTSQMAAMMRNSGVIIANDVAGERLKPLGLNLQRSGIMDTIVVMRANRYLSQVFDRVLVDAPCSGTGTIRRSLKTLQMWSPGLIARLVAEQRKLIELGFSLLKAEGTLVYSTCTQEPAENEGLVSWFLARHPDAELLPIELDIRRSPAVTEFDGVEISPQAAKCLRIYPQDNNTEGFFVAKIRKNA